MNSLLLKIASVAVVFDFIEAIPVPIRSFGERNVALLSVLSCVGIGAVIGMCVFCKKKKGQFKKFENDGNVDSKSTEYPILKSLNSLDTKKTGAIIPSSPTNLSTDNLLEQSVQYQNESNDDFNSNVLLSSKESLSSASPLPGTRTSYSIEQETASSKNSADFGDEKPLFEGSSVDTGIDDKKESDSSQLDAAVQSLTHLEDVTISFSGRLTFPKEETTASAQEYGVPEDVTPMDSLEDNSSMHETNSIEEALRALDFAIDGEDESDDNSVDEPSFTGYSVELDKRETRNEVMEDDDEICNEKNSSSDSGMDEIEMSEKVTTPDAILDELVRQEATKLVNEVLQVCQSRIEEILECGESEHAKQAVSVEDDFEDFNTGVVLECSTPFVAKRTEEYVDYVRDAKHALFGDENDKTDTEQEDILAQALLGDSKDDFKQVEFELTSKEPNLTYQTNLNDEIDDLEQIYPASNTVIILPVDITHTIGSSSFENEPNCHLPEITIEGATDDAIPDKLTATPMNTPSELGCPTTAEWDKWLSDNATGSGMSRNVQETNDGDCFSSQNFDEGWFLHAQPGCSYDNGCNETYDLLDQNDDLDSTYDLLRKQLTEMLPHAQGAKEVTGCFDDSTGSPDHNGSRDLDESLNAPSTSAAKDNEMIINYKRTLSPIMEESEDESFYNKTSYYKEASNYVESTSTGCMDSLTAMGVNRTLMASNDTLFNFEDVLDEILSPRIPSQSHTPTNRDRDIAGIRSPRHVTVTESTSTNDLIPQLARDSSLSSTGDTARIDFSQDSTFTLDEKTCISLSRPNEEDERISEISEPILVSSSSGLNKPDDANSLLDEDIVSIEDDSFDRILEKEKPLENDQYNHFLDLRNSVEPMLELDPPEPDENFDPASMLNNTGPEAVYLQNKINLESMYTNRNLDEQVVIESIDRFLLKSRNISLPDDKSTNPLVNGHLSSAKISSRSDGKNICINYDN